MKRILCAVAILGCSMGVWAANDSFTFVSTLSAPVASFREVETKQSVVIPANSQFNAGSAVSSQGTILLKGTKPMEMDTLTMQNNTTISGDAKWLVDTLNIHTNGSVQVGNLIANKVEITVPEGDTTAKLTANNLLVAGDPLQMHDAVATSSMLVTDGTGGLPFHFVSGGSTPSGNANVNVTAGNIFVFAGD